MRRGGRICGRYRWWICLVIAVALPLTAQSASPAAAQAADGPWSGVSVTDYQGWTLRDVTLKLAADGASLVIVRGDGAEKPLPFDDVVQVLDAEGRDITAEVLTGAAAGEEEPAPPPVALDDNPEFAPAPIRTVPGRQGRRRAEPPQFGFAIDLGGGVAGVAGDWFWGADDGAFVQAGLRLGLTDRRYLHLIFRHQSLGDYTYSDAVMEPLTFDLDMDSFQLLLGGHTRRQEAKTLRSFGYFEGGVGMMRITGNYGRTGSSLSRFAFAMQAGLWLMATDNAAVDIGLHAFYKPGWLTDDEPGGTSLGLHAAAMLIR